MPVPWWSRKLIGVHILGLIVFGIAVYAGNWQLGVWQAQRESSRVDLTQQPVVPLSDVFGPDDAFPGDGVGRPVSFSGEWVPESTVYVTPRESDGVAGYWIVTPVTVDGTAHGSAIPVVRGWLPDIDAVPAPPTGRVEVTAWLQPGEGSLVNDTDTTDNVLPQMRMADLIQHVDQDLYGGYAISQSPTAGLETAELAQMPKSSSSEGLRNFLYALEWWFFGGFAIFLWWRFAQEIRHPDPDEADGDGDRDGDDPEKPTQDASVSSEA